MTEKERFIKALKREPITGRVPHFELVFYLTMEAFGKLHPTHRSFYQWGQMSHKEQKLHIEDIADCYIAYAEKYQHSAIFVQTWFTQYDILVEILRSIKEKTNDEYFTMIHGDPTFAMPDGENMIEFSAQMYEEPEKLKSISEKNTNDFLEFANRIKSENPGLLDGFALCSDYCFNTNPFFSPDLFDEFITPYLKQVIDGYREMGYYSIKHTDGNIMPILQQMVDCGPDALHSLDPQGGVDLKEVKSLVGDKVCLIGNVNCGLLQTGSEEECIADVRRSLRDGMPGYGYIFSTSNCVYTGLDLDRYELMHKIWLEEGIYK